MSWERMLKTFVGAFQVEHGNIGYNSHGITWFYNDFCLVDKIV